LFCLLILALKIPFNTAFLTISTLITFKAFLLATIPRVPTPLYKSKTISLVVISSFINLNNKEQI